MGESDEDKYGHPIPEPANPMRTPDLDHTKGGELVHKPSLREWHHQGAAEPTVLASAQRSPTLASASSR
jgi:hypothetical protein